MSNMILFSTEYTIVVKNIPQDLPYYKIDNGQDTLAKGNLEESRIIKINLADSIDANRLVFIHNFNKEHNQENVNWFELDSTNLEIEFTDYGMSVTATAYQGYTNKFKQSVTKIESDLKSSLINKEEFTKKMKTEIIDFFMKFSSYEMPLFIIHRAKDMLTYQDLLEVQQYIVDNKLPVQNNFMFKELLDVIQSKNIMQVGKVIDNFKLKNQLDKEINLNEIKTDYILLDFWASWCGPCIEKFPKLKELYAKNEKKLTVIAISIDTDKNKWLKALNKSSDKFVNVIDDSIANLSKLYSVNKIPFTILINSKKEIIAVDPDFDTINRLIK